MLDPSSQQRACDVWQREVGYWQPIGQVVAAKDVEGKFILRILGLPTRIDRDLVLFLQSRARQVSAGTLPRVAIAYGSKVFTDHLIYVAPDGNNGHNGQHD